MDDTRGWPVAEVAADRELVEALLRDHRPDGARRCCGCALDPLQRPAWPCTPHLLATAARRLRNGRGS